MSPIWKADFQLLLKVDRDTTVKHVDDNKLINFKLSSPSLKTPLQNSHCLHSFIYSFVFEFNTNFLYYVVLKRSERQFTLRL